VPLKTAAPSAMKPAYLGGRLSSLIAMNSDSIALNAKGLGNTDKKPYSPGGDIHAYAARNINICANTSINLETEYGSIHLGGGLGIADNPVVKGKELNDFLTDLIDKMVIYVDFMSGARSRTDIVKASNDFKKDMTTLKGKLGETAEFFSKKVYVINDHNPPDVSEPQIDNKVSDSGDDNNQPRIFPNEKWEDVVITKEPRFSGIFYDDDVQFDED
jgi:hypothetical protein